MPNPAHSSITCTTPTVPRDCWLSRVPMQMAWTVSMARNALLEFHFQTWNRNGVRPCWEETVFCQLCKTVHLIWWCCVGGCSFHSLASSVHCGKKEVRMNQESPSKSETVRAHIWVKGRVQGVGFRAHVEYSARQIGGLTGWVRNVRDDTVETLAEGEAAKV